LELLVIRHGVAEDRDAFAESGEDDSLRPLTKEGRLKMEHAAKGLRRALRSLDVIATSPFKRAEQTAKIVARTFGHAELEPLDALTPDGTPRAFMTWLRGRSESDRVAVVGHDPHLPMLVSWLVTGEAIEGRFRLRKGGACLLEIDGQPRAGKAIMRCLLTPSLLRRLGK
jgi:phosphohistidine phosphatase